jgi:uncharacterized membrane protein HdeD (DUF308 family)
MFCQPQGDTVSQSDANSQDTALPGGAALLLLGVLMLLLGGVAIALPLARTVAIDHMLGIMFVAAGAVYLLCAAGGRCLGGAALGWVIGLLALAAGALMLLYPLGGSFTLTLLLAAYFVVDGILKFIAASQVRPNPGSAGMCVAGVVSCALGVLFAINIAGRTFWIVGLMVGVGLLFAGLSMLLTGRGLRKAAKTSAA